MQQEHSTPRQDRDTIWRERWTTAWLVCALLWLVDDICLYPFGSLSMNWAILTPFGWGAPILILATLISALGCAATRTDLLWGHPKRTDRRRRLRIVFALLLSLLALACYIGLFVLSSQFCQQHPQACE